MVNFGDVILWLAVVATVMFGLLGIVRAVMMQKHPQTTSEGCQEDPSQSPRVLHTH